MYKSFDSCPALDMSQAKERLIDGKVTREDAVLLWDCGRVNLEIGLFPSDVMTIADQEAWWSWASQWHNRAGWPFHSERYKSADMSPEGILSDWIARGMDQTEIAVMRKTLEARIHGFSWTLVLDYVEQRKGFQ
ncbi:hypothetical protein LMG31506_05737 [Cupriavidus yeoncheonensis]|uniref:Uncharacterized protein n=1 Tax=Cupriavidus yeoncheonensis TaxID=1462994 RepID=A0A916IZV9_9BURK|nr:hypothetical protein [Cupriavidus yeoncheonensis]CAG2156582.1 hypothetical protein LMG31506_05737 [Cupriavidus yeoncheonensis]